MYAYSYLKTATAILEMYTGEVPLAIHLKSYFKLNKKMGSKDRKYIAHLCYCYFRTGTLFKKEPIADAITKSLFLCATEANSLLEQLHADYNAQVQKSLEEKIAFLVVTHPDRLFPLWEYISAGVDKIAFFSNQLVQPFLYIRIRPKYLAKVLIQFKSIEVAYKIIDPYTIQLPNSFKVEEHFILNKEVVIQDYSSQMVIEPLLQQLKPKHSYKVWDCCAASGGKTILLHDVYDGTVDLFVTDIRATILDNLEKRFLTARITNYKIAEVNLAKKGLDTKDKFDIIICDAPCSGSGTWARTPEQIRYFKQKQLEEYNGLQKSIAKNAMKSLQLNGYFLYITCSVFAQENEHIVDYLLQQNSCTLIHAGIIPGYLHHADTMFVALFKNGVEALVD
jgi:16S rRNA (cytosine967-C5)-methyltransferase